MQKINIAILLLGLAFPAAAECVPHRVLKVVTVQEPGNETHTLYRLGSRYGRMEAQNDQAHLLFIINEPDIWVINQADNTGQHMLDDDEKPEFHAPVIDTDSKVWKQLEFGCEEPFMKAVGARVAQLDGGVVQYTHEAEGTSVMLTVAKGIPQRLEVTAPDMKYAIRYVAFEMLDETSADRFTKPETIRFVEAKQDQDQ